MLGGNLGSLLYGDVSEMHAKNVFQCQSVYLYVVFLTVCFVLILIVSPWSFFIPMFFKFCIRGEVVKVVWDCRCVKFFKYLT